MLNDSDTQFLVGDQIGPYRIVARVAGSTYRAVHVSGARRALIEIGHVANWREVSMQMLRAQRLVESLQHPGIARIVDRGMLADRRPWMATEVPSGIGLADLVARRPMPAAELVTLIRDVADVLAYAHRLGVVHRALTSRSIVLATGARAYPLAVADWGMPPDDLGVYGAPELSTAAGHDGRADVYSLGVIAFFAATRRFPGEGGVFEVPGVPTGLAMLIARMLAIDPRERPTATDVCGDAEALIDTHMRDTAPMREIVLPLPADDVAYPSGPRLSRPRWTPAPEAAITSERSPTAAGEIVENQSPRAPNRYTNASAPLGTTGHGNGRASRAARR